MTTDTFLAAVRSGDTAKASEVLATEPALLSTAATGGESAIRHALYHGQKPMAHWLVSQGAPVDLFDAVALGDIDRLERLVAKNRKQLSEHSKDGWTPLHLAAFFGYADIVRRLIAAGAPTEAVSRNDHGNTPLHAAVAGGEPETVEALLTGHANPNSREIAGLTPLHLAAHAGNVAAVRYLVDAGAQTDAVSNDGRRPAEMVPTPADPALLELLK